MQTRRASVSSKNQFKLVLGSDACSGPSSRATLIAVSDVYETGAGKDRSLWETEESGSRESRLWNVANVSLFLALCFRAELIKLSLVFDDSGQPMSLLSQYGFSRKAFFNCREGQGSVRPSCISLIFWMSRYLVDYAMALSCLKTQPCPLVPLCCQAPSLKTWLLS